MFGADFSDNAVVLIDGQPLKTVNSDENGNALLVKKAARRIAPGQSVKLQVRNAGGIISDQFIYTR